MELHQYYILLDKLDYSICYLLSLYYRQMSKMRPNNYVKNENHREACFG